MRVETSAVTGSNAIRLQLLGPFRLVVGGHEVELPVRAQHVVARLALGSRPVHRSVLAGSLWPDSSEERAASCLRSALWRIRTAVPGVVHANTHQVWLSPSVTVDVRDLVLLAHGLGDGDVPELAVETLSDDLLPDWDLEWLELERARTRELRLHVLEAMSGAYAASGRHADAVDAAYAVIAAEPLRESARAALIAAHLAHGNRAAARAEYSAFCMQLDHELGLRPSPALTAVVE